MANLHSNDNFSYLVVRELRRLGHDVLTSLDAGRANQGIPDADVLAFAHEKQRAVLTFNRRDFIRLHRHQPAHAGIIVCTEDRDWAALASRIHNELAKHTTLKGKLIRIYKQNINLPKPTLGE